MVRDVFLTVASTFKYYTVFIILYRCFCTKNGQHPCWHREVQPDLSDFIFILTSTTYTTSAQHFCPRGFCPVDFCPGTV